MLKGYGFIFVAASCWAFIGIFSSFAFAQGIEPMEVAFWRALFAWICFGTQALILGQTGVEKRDIPLLVFFGVFGIFVFYVSYLIFLVFKSRTIDHSLVMDNYYQHDMTYQDHYDKVTNRQLLENDLLFRQDKASESLILNFGEAISIEKVVVDFYRPSNSALDFQKEYADIEDSILISTSDIEEGRSIGYRC